jgi:hypothetical protein
MTASSLYSIFSAQPRAEGGARVVERGAARHLCTGATHPPSPSRTVAECRRGPPAPVQCGQRHSRDPAPPGSPFEYPGHEHGVHTTTVASIASRTHLTTIAAHIQSIHDPRRNLLPQVVKVTGVGQLRGRVPLQPLDVWVAHHTDPHTPTRQSHRRRKQQRRHSSRDDNKNSNSSREGTPTAREYRRLGGAAERCDSATHAADSKARVEVGRTAAAAAAKRPHQGWGDSSARGQTKPRRTKSMARVVWSGSEYEC